MNFDDMIKKTFEKYNRPMSTSEISRILNKPKSHVSRKLKTMKKYKMMDIVKNGKRGKKYWMIK